MSTLADFNYTDNEDDVLAVYVNKLLGSSFRSEYKNVEDLSGDAELADGDTPIQLLDCDGSNRLLLLPPGDAAENHPFFITNGSSGSEVLTVKSNDESVTHAELAAGESVLLLPVGDGSYFAITSIDGSTVVTLTGTQTVTNKRVTKRTVTVTVHATPSINTDNGDIFRIGVTGDLLDLNITSLTTNLTGTPTHGDTMIIEYLDDGTPRTITHGASFAGGENLDLLGETVANKICTEGFRWDDNRDKWLKYANWVEA